MLPFYAERYTKALYTEGNDLLRQQLFAEAIIKYREALQRWDHPRIHFFLALAVFQLGDDPLGAYRSLDRALRYQGRALKPDQLERARDYQKLLRGQIVELTITSDQPGVVIKLDGTALPGSTSTHKQWMLPGEHSIVATRPGHETVTRTVLLLPGKDTTVALTLFSFQELTVTSRRWKPWQPWAVLGAGVAVASVGGLLHWRGRVGVENFDDRLFPAACGDLGCLDQAEDSPSPRLRRAMWYQRAGVSSYVLGGTAIAAGLVLVYLNRERTERLDRSDESVRLSIVPILSPAGAGVAASASF